MSKKDKIICEACGEEYKGRICRGCGFTKSEVLRCEALKNVVKSIDILERRTSSSCDEMTGIAFKNKLIELLKDKNDFNLDDFTRDVPELARELRFT